MSGAGRRTPTSVIMVKGFIVYHRLPCSCSLPLFFSADTWGGAFGMRANKIGLSLSLSLSLAHFVWVVADFLLALTLGREKRDKNVGPHMMMKKKTDWLK